MTGALLPADVEHFRTVIARRLALWFDDGKLDYLTNVLERRQLASSEDLPAYLAGLEAANGHAELREIARELTVGETYFFRHADQFRAFSELALPERIAARSSTRQLRMLSAGCSSGEEAYSLAILTQQRLQQASWAVSITGIDVNPDALARAAVGRYSAWSLRETPADFQKRYFVADGRNYTLAKVVQESVEFREQNLIDDYPWLPGSLDIVFCRNVLMYFTRENAACALRKLALALAPGGYLFLGSAETLRGLSEDFELQHTHDTFYYRRKGSLARSPIHVQTSPPTQPEQTTTAPQEWTSEWLAAVTRSSARIEKLTNNPTAEPESALNPHVAPPLGFSLALELLAQERFAEALAALQALAPSEAQNADAVLLRAALLTHGGELDAADLACTELMTLDSLSSGAHYLRALCRERGGDTDAALEHAKMASYLDPGFAMPHLHLGLMARRAGDRSTAQRELTQAALLLQREEASRLLLFGGGFDRNALLGVCRSELERLGDRA